MPDVVINGIIVNFPFKPYPLQEDYMAKVLECLQNGKHGVLESPTGTGKTLSLLCSSLSWLIAKKAQIQAQPVLGINDSDKGSHFLKKLQNDFVKAVGTSEVTPSAMIGWGTPKIIYASRTHSQLSQAMQELKRTSYKHVKAAVLGSRDQLCIHPDVSKEQSSFHKIHLCHSKVKNRNCFYYNNVEIRKTDPLVNENILDIEDLVKVGQKLKCCPYFLTRELKQQADITFMPYNYLLDPKSRKSQGIEIQNNVILLDEAHNVEKTCEDAASLQISSTDVAMCIEEVTAVMKDMSNENMEVNDFTSYDAGGAQKDFTAEDLCVLKALFLDLEKAIDGIEIKNLEQGQTFPGGFIFELLGQIGITHGREQPIVEKLDKIISYLTTTSTSPFSRKGNAIQKFNDLLRIVFQSNVPGDAIRKKIEQCYKVYIQPEEQKKTVKNGGWEQKKITTKFGGKMISYWCFSPGFGMEQLVKQGVHSIILTSGTLSPLEPFISELGIPIDVQLENPHIITGQQVCVGVVSAGPDSHRLDCSYNSRNDPKYISSLGRTIFNVSCLVPHGMLVFFPSYPIMRKCRDEWQKIGLWTKISDRKPIYVEPQNKEEFTNVMNEYYQKIRDPSNKGAIFMAVCRGKVSEGLDFADINGRAVLVTGLPFPPLKDPRVVLKQRYLEEIRVKEKKGLTGQQWYRLEASRAINQAIGRIIRHKSDYGAVILCDYRFEGPSFCKELSSWLRPHIKSFNNFGVLTKELREFFRYAERALPYTKGPSNYNQSEFSLPAVTPNLSTTSMKNRPNQDKTENSKVQDIFNMKTYTGSSKKSSNDQPGKSLLDSFKNDMRPVVNFSACKLQQNLNTCELTKDANEPLVKRRKFKMLSVEYDPNKTEASSSGTQVANTTQMQSLRKSNESCSNDQSNDDKKQMGKAYLKEVKRSLSPESYKEFASMIQSYTKTGDFNALIKTLDKLVPLNGELQHLFTGFQSFVKGQHISSFNAHIAQSK